MARDVARGIAALIGLILTGLGALGLVDNPLVGEHGLFGASPLLDLANVALGAFALAASFARIDHRSWNGLIALGAIEIGIVGMLLLDPSVAGVLVPRATLVDVLLYASTGLVAIAVGVAAHTTTRAVDAGDDW